MEQKFKKGDWVERINNKHKHLVVGGIYQVDSNGQGSFDLVVDGASGCNEDNFKLAKNTIIHNILKDL